MGAREFQEVLPVVPVCVSAQGGGVLEHVHDAQLGIPQGRHPQGHQQGLGGSPAVVEADEDALEHGGLPWIEVPMLAVGDEARLEEHQVAPSARA